MRTRKLALPRWAETAFVARCARRLAAVYVADQAEPLSPRALVFDAVRIAEASAARGGDPCDVEMQWCEIDGSFFDPYDIEAMAHALSAFENASLNTAAEVSTGAQIQVEDINLAAVQLAAMALTCAFPDLLGELGNPVNDALELLQSVEIDLHPVRGELEALEEKARSLGWNEETGVPALLVGPEIEIRLMT